ncbi:MAG: hypothetical protein HZB68_04530 [Candidatus Aenigmarchaeota archaeon]|nr:hypothetical protein [Candidatus Aenigmarchaeota archaeon]
MKNPYDRFKDDKLEEPRVKEGSLKSPLDEDIMDIYKWFLAEEDFTNAYWGLVQSVGKFKLSSTDVSTFAKNLPYYENHADYSWKSGIFITELVNHMEESEIYLDFSLLREKIDHVGYILKGKKIVIDGDVGPCLGMGMDSGEITINGNAGKFVGHEMRSGKITVNGKAQSAGSCMHGGAIEIREADDPHSWKAWKNNGTVSVAGEKIW